MITASLPGRFRIILQEFRELLQRSKSSGKLSSDDTIKVIFSLLMCLRGNFDSFCAYPMGQDARFKHCHTSWILRSRSLIDCREDAQRMYWMDDPQRPSMATPLGNPNIRVIRQSARAREMRDSVTTRRKALAKRHSKFLTSSSQNPSTFCADVVDHFSNLWVFVDKTVNDFQPRRKVSCNCHVRVPQSSEEASFAPSCLVFTDSTDSSLTSNDARARLRRTRALPKRHFLLSSSPFEIPNHSVVTQAANTSTQTDNDPSKWILCRESISDNHGAFVRTIISLTSTVWPRSIHFASGERENQENSMRSHKR